MSGTVNIGGILYEWQTCITCGVVYTVPEALINHQRKEGGYHYCCNGHSQGWSKEQSQSEKTRLERDRLRQQLAQKDDEINAQIRARESAENKLSQATKTVRKLTVRASAGTCPCCNRTVSQMARHMKSKHPEFIATAIN